MVIQAIQSILSLLIIIGIGFFITGRNWFPEWGADFLSKFTARVLIPCYMFHSVITTTDSPEQLKTLFAGLPLPYFTILVSVGLGLVLTRLLKVSSTRRGVFINAVSFSNTVLIGFTVVQALFGEKALPDAMIYYMANTTLFWTIGTYLLRRDSENKQKLGFWQELRHIISPPIVSFALGVVVVLLGLQIPVFIMTPIGLLKQATLPIAMIFTGSIIRNTDFKQVKLTRELVMVLLVRFILTPIFMILLLRLMPIPILMKQVFFLLATMPAMTQLGIMSKVSDSDYEFASLLVTVTTTFSMLILPLYTLILVQWRVFG